MEVPQGVDFRPKGVVVMGVLPIGTEEHQREFLDEKLSLRDSVKDLDALPKIRDPPVALLLLRFGIAPRFSYLARMLPPSNATWAESAAVFDTYRRTRLFPSQ